MVAAMGKYGLTYRQLVQEYLRNNGASDKIIEGVNDKLTTHEWEKLKQECGYRA